MFKFLVIARTEKCLMFMVSKPKPYTGGLVVWEFDIPPANQPAISQ